LLETLPIDPTLLTAILTGLLLSVAAFITGRWLGASKASAAAQASKKSETSEAEEVRELRKTTWILQNENKNLSTFLTLLPDLARELNNTHDRRRIAPLLKRMIEQIFDPEQILIFYTTHRNDGLVLVDEKGLSQAFDRNTMIPFGEGRIGWVASHQISMDDGDFGQRAAQMKADFHPASHPHFKVELAAPMGHQERTLGVITVGGMLRHPKNEKTMLKMVADLGSIALNNAFLFHQADQLINSDGLTGICNKRFFLQRIAEEIMRSESRHEEFSLFIFDIDHFKHYNDNNGHLAGDEALKTTGRILRESIREDDVPARYGGEEFVVLLPSTPKVGALTVAEKIRAAIQDHEYPKEKNQPGGDLTISGGVAAYPYDGKTSAEIISAADDALYKAKRGGRNRVLAFQPTYLSEGEETSRQPVVSGRRTA
jgi:diguanylate cyclase (GGDEF)-like protein